MPPSKPKNNPKQVRNSFAEMAREVGADETPGAFEKAFEKIVPQKRPEKKPAKQKPAK